MINVIKDKWNEIIEYLRNEFGINDVLFRTWILPLSILSYENKFQKLRIRSMICAFCKNRDRCFCLTYLNN